MLMMNVIIEIQVLPYFCAGMKQAISCILAGYLFLGSLFPGNSFFDLSSIPNLVRHYEFHRLSNGSRNSLSIMEFLKLHYSGSAHQNTDPVRHQNLPLQHSQQANRSVEWFSVPAGQDYEALACRPPAVPVPLKMEVPESPSDAGIFHPPACRAAA